MSYPIFMGSLGNKKENVSVALEASVEVGIVKWFNEQKGFGFIEQPNGRDLFVHYKEIRGKLKQGDKVQYILGEGDRGPIAKRVKVIEPAPST